MGRIRAGRGFPPEVMGAERPAPRQGLGALNQVLEGAEVCLLVCRSAQVGRTRFDDRGEPLGALPTSARCPAPGGRGAWWRSRGFAELHVSRMPSERGERSRCPESRLCVGACSRRSRARRCCSGCSPGRGLPPDTAFWPHPRGCAGPRLLALGGLDAFARGGLQDLLIK